MNRRHFLGAGVAGAISLHRFPYPLFAAAKPKNATDRILLGPRKIEFSRMAMGTGTSGSNGSSNQTRKLGYHGVAELFRAAFDQGINFWDSADQYGSHTYIREALKTVPREKVVILTKTNSTTAAAVKADIDRYRRELGVDQIDILLLHAQQAADWNVRMRPCMDVISEARDRGIVRSSRHLLPLPAGAQDRRRGALGGSRSRAPQSRRTRTWIPIPKPSSACSAR